MCSVDLLRRVIRASGLTQAEFARVVVARSPVTVSRWLHGRSPIPGTVLERLRELDSLER